VDEQVVSVPDDPAMRRLGAELARASEAGAVIFLEGELGTGKTTLVRGFLAALGQRGAVRSPTYTLVEPYELAGRRIYHLDLYRLGDPEELEFLGIRDLLEPAAVTLVEWPERGRGWLPEPDLVVHIDYAAHGRVVHVRSVGMRGGRLLRQAFQDSGDLGG
jgi:tRNA threonylcarbamoyladenosine biosynthesis protein TsaE